MNPSPSYNSAVHMTGESNDGETIALASAVISLPEAMNRTSKMTAVGKALHAEFYVKTS